MLCETCLSPRDLDTDYKQNQGFESLHMCIHKKGDPQPIQFICMYASPKITFEVVKKTLLKV